jgi:hypothetical protein
MRKIMALDDLIAKFESFTNPVETETPDIDVVLSGVTEVYNRDISVRDQAVTTYKEKLEKQVADNAALKQANYDLLIKLPQTTVAPNKRDADDPDELDDAERAATIKVADLFTKRK